MLRSFSWVLPSLNAPEARGDRSSSNAPTCHNHSTDPSVPDSLATAKSSPPAFTVSPSKLSVVLPAKKKDPSASADAPNAASKPNSGPNCWGGEATGKSFCQEESTESWGRALLARRLKAVSRLPPSFGRRRLCWKTQQSCVMYGNKRNQVHRLIYPSGSITRSLWYIFNVKRFGWRRWPISIIRAAPNQRCDITR